MELAGILEAANIYHVCCCHVENYILLNKIFSAICFMKLIKTASGKIILSTLVLSCLAVIGVRLRSNFSQIRSVQAFVNGEIILCAQPSRRARVEKREN
jgi:hypothetical protein